MIDIVAQLEGKLVVVTLFLGPLESSIPFFTSLHRPFLLAFPSPCHFLSLTNFSISDHNISVTGITDLQSTSF